MDKLMDKDMADINIKIDDCWNKIGVWGHVRPGCPELEKIIHCANCKIYSAAARQLLDRDISPGYMQEGAATLAQIKTNTNTKKHNTTSIVIFRIGEEWLGLPTHLFQEVVQFRNVHSIPHRRGKILRGLVNIRGELQLCVSLGQLLDIKKGEIQGINIARGIYERMIVIAKDGMRYVFPVGEVRGIRRYSDNDLLAPPATVTHGAKDYLSGLVSWKEGGEERHIGCLDEALLFPALERGIT